jgi:hypothetical protein
LVDEWMNRLQHIQAMEYLVLERQELRRHEETWGKLTCMLWSDTELL